MLKGNMPKMNQNNTGSVGGATEPRFFVVGRVARPHGVLGEVRVEVHTDVDERFESLEKVFLSGDVADEHPRPVAIESARLHHNVVLLKLAGVDSREQAETLRRLWLLVDETDVLPLAEGEYYLYQLEGLAVYCDDGQHLGRLSEVLETKANNVFVVQGEQGEVLLPDIPEVILKVDIDSGRIIVHLIPGLI